MGRGARWPPRWPTDGRSRPSRPTGPRRRRRPSSAGRDRRCRGASRSPPNATSARTSRNTSVVLDERVLLKAYRRLQPGLNPDLELTAYLTEEAGFAAVPPLAGFAEVISARHGTATVAIAQAFVADGADALRVARRGAHRLDPRAGRGQRRVRDRGRRRPRHAHRGPARRAGLGAMPRRSSHRARRARPNRRRWATDAAAQLERALAVTPDDVGRSLRELAPAHRRGADAPRDAARHAAAHPGPRRLPPRPDPARTRRLPDHRLRGRADPVARRAARPRVAAARRGVDAPVARPRRPEREAPRDRAKRGTGRVAGPGPRGVVAPVARALPRRLSGRTPRGRRPDRVRRRPRCARSRSTRRSTSSSTRRPGCRRGCGHPTRACAGCSRTGA